MLPIRRAVFVFLLVLVPAFAFAQSADQEVMSVVDAPDPVTPGATLTYTITVTNHGPDPAVNGGFNTNLPGEVTYQGTVAPAGFSCATFGAAVSCTNPSWAPGTAVFTMTVQVAPHLVNFPDGSFGITFSPSGVTTDPNHANDSKSATTAYNTPQVDVELTASDAPDPVTPNQNVTYTVNIKNNGPDPATNVNFSMPHNGGSFTFQSMTTPAGWSCPSPPSVGSIANFTCTKATLNTGITDTFTIVVKAEQANIGANDTVINQNFNAAGTGDDTNDNNSSVTVSTAYVTPDADIQITASDSPDPVFPDGDITYTVTVTNAGPDTATNAILNVPMNNTLLFQSVTQPAGWTCTPPAVGGGSSWSCSNPSFALGSSVFTIVLRANDEQFGINDQTIVQNFSAGSSLSDPNNGNNSINVSTAYVTPDADIQVTASDSPDPVFPDGDITYTVTVTNAGPDTAPNAILNVPMNNTLRFQSVTQPAGWTCSPPAVGGGTSWSCTNPSFALGSAVFTIVLRANDEQFGINDQTIVQNFGANSAVSDPNNANNSVNVSTAYVTPDADIQITASDSPDPVAPDGDITYTVTVTNAGPDTATNAILNVPMNNTLRFQSVVQPAGWTCSPPSVGAGTSWSCTRASFPVGSSVFTIVLRANDEQFGINDQTIVQNFSANSGIADPNNANNSVNVSTLYSTPDANVSIIANDSADPITNGDNLAFSVTATNNGPDTGTNATVTFAPHPSLVFQSITPQAGWACTTPAVGAAGVTQCTKASMANGETANFMLVTKLVTSGPGGTLDSDFSVGTSTQDPVLANNSVEVLTNWIGQTADLWIAKSTLATAAAQGETITYTISTANNGPYNATNVTVTDTLHPALLFQSISVPAGWNCTTPAVGANGTITCTAATFINGTTANFTLVTTVTPNATGSITNGAAISSPDAVDPSAGNSSASSSTTAVAGDADLIVTKDANVASAPRGGTIQYTITVTNVGPDPAASVVMSDVLPASLLFQSILAPAGWSCTTPAVGATGTITCTSASQPIGAPASFALAVTVASNATGTITNTATAAHSGPDPNGGNSSATSAPIPVTTAADLSIAKTTTATTVAPGQTFTYTIAVTNNGPDAATNVVMTDVLPASLLFQSITPAAGFNCVTPAVGANGTVTCTAATLAVTTANFTLGVQVAPSATPGAVANTATVAAAEEATGPNNSSTSGGPNVVTANDEASIPTLSEWALIALGTMLGLVAIVRMRT